MLSNLFCPQRKRSGESVRKLEIEWLNTYKAILKFLSDCYAYVHTCGDIVCDDELVEMPSAPVFDNLEKNVFINPEIKATLKKFVLEMEKFTETAIDIIEKDQDAELALKIALQGENEVLRYQCIIFFFFLLVFHNAAIHILGTCKVFP